MRANFFTMLLLLSEPPVLLPRMEEIVNLGESSQCPSIQMPIDLDCELEGDYADGRPPSSLPPAVAPAGLHGGGRFQTAQSSLGPSQSQNAAFHKVRGPNWTEAEMLVLIAQNRIEWDGRHNCNQLSLAKFVYDTTAWKLVLAGCMSVVDFRARDTDQTTNKWDGLIKDYKKLKEYIDGTGSTNWWGLNRKEKKTLSKIKKMSLVFIESMYIEMEGFVGKRQIFGRATDEVDSDRVPQLVVRQFCHSPPMPRGQSLDGMESPIVSVTAASDSPSRGTPGDDTSGSTGRKRKAVGNDNLVDFVKDFDFEFFPTC